MGMLQLTQQPLVDSGRFGVSAVVTAYYDRKIESAVNEQLEQLIIDKVKDYIRNDKKVNEYIYQQIDNVIKTLPIDKITTAVREVVNDCLAKPSVASTDAPVSKDGSLGIPNHTPYHMGPHF